MSNTSGQQWNDVDRRERDIVLQVQGHELRHPVLEREVVSIRLDLRDVLSCKGRVSDEANVQGELSGIPAERAPGQQHGS